MDKLEHFIKKNHHRIIHYFTTMNNTLLYVMVLSVYDGAVYMVDLRDGLIPYVDTGGFQRRFYVGCSPISHIPEPVTEQPIDQLLKNEVLLQGALGVLKRRHTDGNLVVLGTNYMMDVAPGGMHTIFELTDFPDTLEQHGIFQKYDLDYFYSHKHTISQNVKNVYDLFHMNFLENLHAIQKEWQRITREPETHLHGFDVLLGHYDERTHQYGELRQLVIDMYRIWKQLSSEYDMLGIQSEPVSFDQNLKINQKKQVLYRRLDKIKLIEKHATDLLVKMHISRTCLMFYIHLLSCEMGEIQNRFDSILDTQSQVRKYLVENHVVFHD